MQCTSFLDEVNSLEELSVVPPTYQDWNSVLKSLGAHDHRDILTMINLSPERRLPIPKENLDNFIDFCRDLNQKFREMELDFAVVLVSRWVTPTADQPLSFFLEFRRVRRF